MSRTTPTSLKYDVRFVAGYPRSGNNWLSRTLGDLTDSIVSNLDQSASPSIGEEGHNRPGPYAWVQQHFRPHEVKCPGVFIIRDPRDVVVSLVHYRKRGSIREAIDINRPLEEQHDATHAFQKFTGTSKRLTGTWQDFNRSWLETDHPFTRYEWMHKDLAGELRRLADEMDLEVVHDFDEVAARQSFKARRELIDHSPTGEYPFGSEFERFHLRSGKVGDWINHIDREVGEYLAPLWWPLIQELGYEENDAWWKDLPSGGDPVA